MVPIDALPPLEQRFREVLAGDPAVRWAYLFGSAARGEAFEEAMAGLRVDVVDLASAAPALAGRIAREGRVLVDHEPEVRRSWELEANRRALDIAPWLAEFERLRNEALRRRGTDGRSG